MIPGVTTRKRFAKRASDGAITLLIACQAISIAITTVLPVPVAIFRPTRGRPALCSALTGSRRRAVVGRAVPPGDLGQEDRCLGRLALAEEDRILAVGSRSPVGEELAACRASRRSSCSARHRSTSRRMSLISEFSSTRSPVASKSSACCSPAPLLGFGTGMKDSLGRRPSLISPVGPRSPSSKCRSGGSNGELRIGFERSASATGFLHAHLSPS